jgi:hypothetical protein
MAQIKYNYYMNIAFPETKQLSWKQNNRRLHNPQKYAIGIVQA